MSLQSDLLQQAKQWRQLADQASDAVTRQALIDLAMDYEATAGLRSESATGADQSSAGGTSVLPWSEGKVPPDVDEIHVAELRDKLAEDLRAIALPIVMGNPTGSAALMALAEVAGDVVAAVSTSTEHLEEGLRIFARLTRDRAANRPLGRK